MNCSKCGGRTVARTIRICACETTPPTIVENVPARVCSQCGEQELTDQTIGALERMRDGMVVSRIAQVRVFDFIQEPNRVVRNGGQRNVVTDAGTTTASGLTGGVGTHSDPVYA